MSNIDVSWLAAQNTHDFFMRFPLPLAVLDKDGNIKLLNKRFTAIFDSSCLKSDKLRQMLLSSENMKQAIPMLQSNDCQIDVYARTIHIDNDVILILDESAETAYSDELSELRQHITELEKLISNDRLTGAWNRTHFDKVLRMELSRSVRYHQAVTLIFLDIDHFKSFNDSHGYAAGDEVLRELVKTISKNIRSSDMLFRWEGAQFAILAPSTNRHAAEKFAETLRSKIEQHGIAPAGHITVSVGVAEHVSGESEGTWFMRANEALRQAKRGGRNCVVADPHSSSELRKADQETKVVHLEWLDSYACGEATIDGQHRELFELANALIDAGTAMNIDPHAFDNALQTLLTHLEQHFASEEAILAAHHHPSLDVQAKAHKRLLEHVTQLRNAAAAGSITLGELVDFLTNEVIARHMLKTDIESCQMLKEAPPVRDS